MYKQGEFLTVENYHILKNEMKNLDLLMFRGDDIISDIIADIQNEQQFTHAGLVIHSNLLPGYNLKPDHLYVLESTYSYNIEGMDNGPPDSITGQRFFGVQIRDLERVCKSYLHNYKTKIAWFALESPISLFEGSGCKPPIINDFVSIFRKYHQRPFLSKQIVPIVDFTQITPDVMMMAKSIINETLLDTILQSSFSCVNLVISVYTEVGLIDASSPRLYPIELLHLTRKSIS